MEWIESKIYTTQEGLEAVGAVLMSCGINSFIIQDKQEMLQFLEKNPFQWDYVDDELMLDTTPEIYVQFYVTADPVGVDSLNAVKNELIRVKELGLDIPLGGLDLVQENVDDKEWLEQWKKYYKPFNIGGVVIKPVWEQYNAKAGETVFNINPGHVFGTGLHQTTQLCIEQLTKKDLKCKSVLDLGCGSGILSIISLILGAEYAIAVDIDPGAAKIAYENAELNQIGRDRYSVLTGNVVTDDDLRAEITQQRYDIVIANIVADVIINMSGIVTECLIDGGLFISSGIIKERLEDVKNTLLDKGFQIEEIINKDDWICIVARLLVL